MVVLEFAWALAAILAACLFMLGAALSSGNAGLAGDVGLGAMLAALFLRVTPAMFVVGASAYGFRNRR
ncbi:MAG: hypothetical protein AVDCRST_MAG55-1435 [uncultured Rubrobacteraceae bacterium]|uniref:Uncharacterized protein n=1 Tax=uncultured Rubrobacteraceae bacterium TaxID=349277 RepID=A0A6J4PDK7_9ACTN|nr:MAG: hypothetical protein AVDCRST_MAG55-1435 [uncultured Rubrobacteraceae bacterium]